MNLLELQQVSKNFGAKQVLNQLDLSVPEGSIYGFVGENGAGKTTTMKLILGLEEVSGGQIFVKGEQVSFGSTPTNRITGYLPDVPAFYPYMTAKEYLNLCGEITGMEKSALQLRVQEMLELVGLAEEKKKIKGYSRGMKQRLGIAQALLNEPELLICDEPTSALDPAGRSEFLDLLASLKGRTTILFSTHILSDVERICDYVGILNEGRMVVADRLENLQQQYAKPQIRITYEDSDKLGSAFAELENLQKHGIITELQKIADNHQLLATYEQDYDTVAAAVMQSLITLGSLPQSLERIELSLEQIFFEVTGLKKKNGNTADVGRSLA